MRRSRRLEAAFPNLRRLGYTITSPADERYNCIAWAAGDDSQWWEPDEEGHYYWPTPPGEFSLATLVEAFEALGYAPCPDSNLEPGFEKVAIYADEDDEPTHVVRQLSSGTWTSKCGMAEDITHTLEGLEGGAYGRVVLILTRPSERA